MPTTLPELVTASETKRRFNGWRLDALALGAILLLLILLMRDALFSSNAVLGQATGDGATQFFPWRVFGFEAWRNDGLPLWNPYSVMGMPFVGNLQSAMFYPTDLLCFLLPIPVACNWSILINMFLSAAFTYILARTLKLSRPGSCLAALTFTLSANHLFRVYQGHWSIIQALPWVPLLTLCTEMIVRKRSWLFVALGGVAVSMQILAGAPQHLFYTGIFASIYFIARLFAFGERPNTMRERLVRIGMFAAIFPIGVALGAAELFPAMELVQQCSRGERMTLEWAGSYSLPPPHFLSLIVPHVWGPTIKNGGEAWTYWGLWNFWEVGFYMGLVSLMLFIAAVFAADQRRWWPIALSGLFFLLLALGPNGIVLTLFYGHVPGFDLFRAPARALSLVGLSLGMMAGMGLDVILTGNARYCRRAKMVFALFAGIILAGTIVIELAGSTPPETWSVVASTYAAKDPHMEIQYSLKELDEDFFAQTWNILRDDTMTTVIFTTLAGAIVLLPFRRPRLRLGMAVALVVLAAADFYQFDRPFMVVFNSNDHIWNSETISRFQKEGKEHPFRVINKAEWARFACQPMIYHISSIEGIEPNVPTRFHDFFWMSQGENLTIQHTDYEARQRPAVFDLVNMKYVTMPAPNGPDGGRRVHVLDRPRCLERAFIAHEYKLKPDRIGQLEWLRTWDHEDYIILEEDPREPCEPLVGQEPSPVFKRYDIHGAEISVSLNSPGFLVLSDLYYPGWIARVDGKTVRIHRADYLLRAIAVPKGEHTVEFKYVCPTFSLGAALSVVTAGLLISYCYYALYTSLQNRNNNRKRKPAPLSKDKPKP